MTFDERVNQAWNDGVLAKRGRLRAGPEGLHQHHAHELLKREQMRVLRGGTYELDSRLHFERGALHVLDPLLKDYPTPRDCGEDITEDFLDQQLVPDRRPWRTAK